MTLPNFLIIGAAKGGTTSLYNYLRQHPDIYMSPMKEPNYFTDEDQLFGKKAVRSRGEYERLFDGVTNERAIGEATPRYLNAIGGVGRIHADLPGVRLIVTLRQPADRGYSAYLQRFTDSRERRSADEVLQPRNYQFEAGRYHAKLRRYFDTFPREQIKIILFDDLVARPRETVQSLFSFLGVDPDFAVDTSVRYLVTMYPRFLRLTRLFNATATAVARNAPWASRTGLGTPLRRLLLRKPDPIPRVLWQRLTDQYRDDIIATAELIGRDLSHWLV
ncbi:MAG: sulfotransferase [Acidobacteria bacterium]|nr:sulfotransferase [Acidobacteriota bacterium]MBV9070531.1 sulfotransferase [Acidobacteriota bacterium]MBV9188445.1 sulfotransferase [Acidobacteriota bacterium]